MAEHIVHIDGLTGSSPVATTREPNRKVRFISYTERTQIIVPVCSALPGLDACRAILHYCLNPTIKIFLVPCYSIINPGTCYVLQKQK